MEMHKIVAYFLYDFIHINFVNNCLLVCVRLVKHQLTSWLQQKGIVFAANSHILKTNVCEHKVE